MLSRLFSPLACLLLCATANAHFVFVVPEADSAKAKVIMSEDLQPDDDVEIGIIGGAKLLVRQVDGEETPVVLSNKVGPAFVIDLPGKGTRVVYGAAELGVRQKGDAKPYLLAYYPKTIVGNAYDTKATLGEKAPVEVIPVHESGKLRFRFVADGKPVESVEITVITPAGEEKKVKTDKEGLTEVFEAKGRYGVWARHFKPETGERDGKKFEEARRYATLVIDAEAAAKAEAKGHGAAMAELPSTSAKLTVVKYATVLPIAASSFGAVASDGYLYVYGGHVSRTHNYSVEAVTGRFARLKLGDESAAAKWEELPGGPGLQGLNLAAHGGKIYRVGGMQPRNYPGTRPENYSIPDVTRFDPATKKWEVLPPMPQGRSSHDVVVMGDKLIVVGGWNMNAATDNTWCNTTLVMDLKADKLAWKEIKQPWVRRALIAAVHQGKIYVMGGIDEESDVNKTVDIYDVAADAWTKGPELPGKSLNGFSPAACVVDGRLFVSVADGTMYRLDEAKKAWENVGTGTPRIVHRLIPIGQQILIVGGAMKGVNLDLIETLQVGNTKSANAAE